MDHSYDRLPAPQDPTEIAAALHASVRSIPCLETKTTWSAYCQYTPVVAVFDALYRVSRSDIVTVIDTLQAAVAPLSIGERRSKTRPEPNRSEAAVHRFLSLLTDKDWRFCEYELDELSDTYFEAKESIENGEGGVSVPSA